MNRYKTKVIETNKLKLKGEDISSTIASVLEAELNEMAEKGWKDFYYAESSYRWGCKKVNYMF